MMQNNSFSKNLIRGLRKRIGKWIHNPYSAVNLNPVSLVYYKHLAPGVIRSHQLFGKPVYFSSATEFVAGLKEIFVDEIYKQQLSEKPYIIDCGANIGLSVIYMKQMYPDAEILAFEPDEKNYTLLKKNVESRQYKSVDLRREAVWNEKTTLQFSANGSTNSRILKDGKGTVSVPAIRLRDFISKPLDFLKIDIEGAEFEVLKDLHEKLDLVKNIFIEYHGSFSQNDELAEILQILTTRGFRYYIKEASVVFSHPYLHTFAKKPLFDLQLNIFGFKNAKDHKTIINE